MNSLVTRTSRRLSAFLALLLISSVAGLRAQTPCPQPGGPSIHILGTNAGVDNVFLHGQEITVYWVAYSPVQECCIWGFAPEFILDGGAGGGNSIQTDYLGGSGYIHASRLDIPTLYSRSCKHSLTIGGYVYTGTTCNANNYQWVTSDNALTLWIDDFNTYLPEDMAHCGGGPTSCSRGEVGHPVDLASGRMYHEMVDLRIDDPLPIELVRRYDSESTFDGPLGYGWQHNFMIRLENPSDQRSQTFIDPEMRRVAFNCANGATSPTTCFGTWQANALDHLTLVQGSQPPWTIQDKHHKQFKFDVYGRLMAIVDRNGNQITVNYRSGSTDLRPTDVSDQYGRGIAFGYDPTTGHLLTASSGGRTVTYTYTGDDLTRVDYPDGRFVTYEYTSLNCLGSLHSHMMRRAVDSTGHVIESHDYDPQCRVRHTESDGGNFAYTMTYDTYPATQTTVANAPTPAVQTVYTIDLHKGIPTDRVGGPGCTSCDGGGDETHKTYDDSLNLTAVTEGSGATARTTSMTYDLEGNMTSRTEAVGTPEARTTTYTYHPDFNFPTSITGPSVGSCSNANKVTTLSYDPVTGDLLSTETTGCNGSEPFDYTTSYSYDWRGEVVSVDGPRSDVSDVTTFTYYGIPRTAVNLRGRLQRITNALAQQSNYTSYDFWGNVLSATDLNGVETDYTYDTRDRLTEARIRGATSDDDIVTQNEYDGAGNLWHVKLPNCVDAGANCAFSYEYTYDGVHRLKEIHDAVGDKIVYTYDPEGNRTREEYRDASNAVTKFTNFAYETFNRLKYTYFTDTAPEDVGSVFYKYTYFNDGSRQTEQDPLGHVTSYTYDGLQRLKTVAQTVGADTLTTTYGYDTQDNLASVTDPNLLQTTYSNSDMGWRLFTVSPDTGTTTSTFDPAGNLLTSHDANGVTVTRAYDALNRPTTVSYPDSSLDVTNTYDSPWVSYGIGRRTDVTDSAGESTFGYDPRGLLISEDRTVGGATFTTGYDFDKSGNLTEVRFPTTDPYAHQEKVDYSYDNANRVSLVTTTAGGVTTTVASALAYKPFGPRTSLTFGNQLVDSRSYDTRYQLGSWTLGSILNYTHGFDNDGNLTSRLDNVNHANDRTFGYDEIYRLTTAIGPWGSGTGCPGSATYSYDKNGNRTCKGEAGTATSYAYTPNTNRLASSTGGEPASYSYDSNGNTTADGTHTYHYNDANRLASVDAGATASYTYDGDNRRAIKTASGATTYFFYDPSGRMLQEYVPATGEGKDYLSLDGAPIARVDWSASQQQVLYYHTDHLGTPIAMTDGSAAPVWKLEHRPFGDGSPTGTLTNNLRFPGQYFDEESGLGQNWFRNYSPRAGRYREADPLGMSAGINLYAYSADNPIASMDPTGLAFCLYDISVPSLTCTTDDFSLSVTIGPGNIFSGFGECANNPSCAGDENVGPVPPGTYELIPTAKYGGSWFLKQSWFARLLHRIPSGGQRHLGRGEFFLHLGQVSAGCITVDKTKPLAVQRFEDLRRVLEHDASNSLHVVP